MDVINFQSADIWSKYKSTATGNYLKVCSVFNSKLDMEIGGVRDIPV